jgi:hypothetical protein
MLLEDCPGSTSPIKEPRLHFPLLPEFNDTSYARRYEILARKLMLEKKYDHAAFLMSTARTGTKGKFTEPAADLTMQKFLLSLAAHVRVCVEAT